MVTSAQVVCSKAETGHRSSHAAVHVSVVISSCRNKSVRVNSHPARWNAIMTECLDAALDNQTSPRCSPIEEEPQMSVATSHAVSQGTLSVSLLCVLSILSGRRSPRSSTETNRGDWGVKRNQDNSSLGGLISKPNRWLNCSCLACVRFANDQAEPKSEGAMTSVQDAMVLEVKEAEQEEVVASEDVHVDTAEVAAEENPQGEAIPEVPRTAEEITSA